MNTTIRQERIGDRRQVSDLIESAFADVKQSDHREHLLVERLRGTDAFVPELSLVAQTEDGRIVGYVLLTEVSIVSQNVSVVSLAVAPLAVLSGFRKKGIGGMLLGEAHRRAAALGYGSAVLLGHKDYYPRFGYRRAGDFGIGFPFDAPAECCMAVELLPGALNGVHGKVLYSDPFFG